MRSAVLGLVIGFSGIQALAAGTARAECAAPTATVAPHSGATVPTDPTLYVFVPSYYADEVQAGVRVLSDGKALNFETTIVSKTNAFWTFRIDVATESASSIELHYGNSKTATYSINPDWEPADYNGLKLHSAEYVRDAWTCSHTDAHFVTVSSAPAYEVEWARTTTGEVHTVVFPHHTDDFWMWGDREPTTGPGKIGLGHLNCMGESAKSGVGYETRLVRVRGLYPDGSSRGRTGGYWIRIPEVAGIHAEVYPPLAPAPRVHRRIANSPRSFSALPLLGLTAFLFGFAYTRVRVRRTSKQTRDDFATLARHSVPQVLCALAGSGAIWLALHAATTADAGATFGFSVAAATWALVAGATAALSR